MDMKNNTEHFKISILIFSVLEIAAWFAGTYILFAWILFPDFRWYTIFILPAYAVFCLVTIVGGIVGFTDQVKKLFRRSK